MLRLNTFGGLVLQEDGQLHTGPASQRRRLALLAVVAASGRRGTSRDKLVSSFSMASVSTTWSSSTSGRTRSG